MLYLPDIASYTSPPTDFIQPPNIHHDNRVIHALSTCGGEPGGWLADQIEDCRKGFSCCSLWCRRCRHRYAKGLQQRIRDQILSPFGTDYDGAYARLRHVTILSDVIPLSEQDWRLKSAIALERKRIYAVKDAYPQVQFQGAFELELIDFQLLMLSACPIKRRTTTALMGYDAAIPAHLIPKQVLVHWHALWDIGNCDVREIRACFEAQYDSVVPYRIKFDRIHKGQAFDELSFKLGSYPFKDRVQYNLSFKTQEYRNGPHFADRDLARLVLLYKRLSVNGLKTMLLGSKV